MSSVITSAPAATSTNAIPNLHGGANPSTPKLAGIISGASIAFAWTVCFIYWWWNRRRERQDQAEAAANRKLSQLEAGGSPTSPRRGRKPKANRSGQAQTFRKYPSGVPVAADQQQQQVRRSGDFKRIEPPHVMSGPLTPMAEVPATEEGGSAINMKEIRK